ncbi:MAG: hypothetical protein ACTSPA_11510 [Promethearchaeota archaeon]
MFEKKNIDDQLSISKSSLKILKPGGIICPICKINPAQIYICPICGRRSIFPCPNCTHSELRCPYCISRKII